MVMDDDEAKLLHAMRNAEQVRLSTLSMSLRVIDLIERGEIEQAKSVLRRLTQALDVPFRI